MTRFRNRSGPLCTLFLDVFCSPFAKQLQSWSASTKNSPNAWKQRPSAAKRHVKEKELDNVTQAKYRIPSNIDQFPLDLQQPRFQQLQVSNEAREGGRDSWKIRVGLSKKPLDIAARLGCIWNA